jgi:alpha-tubulin suppressor-like RCC1 family protein
MDRRRKTAFGLVTAIVMGSVLVGAGSAPVAAVELHTATSISAGFSHTCAVLDDASVKCWGLNQNGRLGLGDTNARGDGPGEMGDLLPPVDLGSGRTATAVTAGYDHTCALLDLGDVKCWGANLRGQLGLGDTADRGDQQGEMGTDLPEVDLGGPAVAVDAGFRFTCALLNNAHVKCWGYNAYGQLGLGDDLNRGDAGGEMGAALPDVNLGSGRTATAIAVDGDHACALLDDGTVKCWGYNGYGELGQGDLAFRGDQPGEMAALTPVPLGSGRTATAVAAGGNNTCAIRNDASLVCWGDGAEGQLGRGSTDVRGDDPNEMGDNLVPVALGNGRTVDQVELGDSSVCAVLDDGSVRCWGENDVGQLGLGDDQDRGDGANEMGDDLPPVALGPGRTAAAVDTGGDQTCAVLDDASVRCWGAGTLLGAGGSADRGDDPNEMGANLPAVDLGGSPPVTYKVDGEIRRSTQTTFVGNGVYNLTGARQTRSTDVRRGRSGTFVLRFRNEASTVDDIRVRGLGSSGRFTVRYSVGSTNVTRQVVAGTYRFQNVPANRTRLLTVRITVAANAVVNSTKAVTVRGISVAEPTVRDTVKATVRARR